MSNDFEWNVLFWWFPAFIVILPSNKNVHKQPTLQLISNNNLYACVTAGITLSDGLSSQHVLFKTDFTDKDYFTILLIKEINYGTARSRGVSRGNSAYGKGWNCAPVQTYDTQFVDSWPSIIVVNAIRVTWPKLITDWSLLFYLLSWVKSIQLKNKGIIIR